MSAESEVGAQLRIGIPRAGKRLTVRSSSPPRSLLRTAALVYFAPLIAVGAFAVLALGFAALAVAFQLAAALLKHAGI